MSVDWIEVREEFESAPHERTFHEPATELGIAAGALLVLALLLMSAVTAGRRIIQLLA